MTKSCQIWTHSKFDDDSPHKYVPGNWGDLDILENLDDNGIEMAELAKNYLLIANEFNNKRTDKTQWFLFD